MYIRDQHVKLYNNVIDLISKVRGFYYKNVEIKNLQICDSFE